MTKHCNENCEFIEKCNSTLTSWYQCNGQKNAPKVELGDECVYNEEDEMNENDLMKQFLNEEDNLDIKLRFEEYKNKKSNWLDWFTEHADIPLNEKDACRFAVNEFAKELIKTLHKIINDDPNKYYIDLVDFTKSFEILGVDISL